MNSRRYPNGLFAAVCVLISACCATSVRAQSTFVPIAPCRIINTRLPAGPLGGPALVGQQARDFPMATSSCIPSGVSIVAYALNVTVAPFVPLSYLTIWPTGQTQPLVSTLNALQGQVLANAAIVPAGTNGSISVYATQATDLLVDINGYYTPAPTPTTTTTIINSGPASANAGTQNTAVGLNTLSVNADGHGNTAAGYVALSSNTSGNNNVAIGSGAMNYNANGSANTGLGAQALFNNLMGSRNTAAGFSALMSNTTGMDNSALGMNALSANATGSYNTALGDNALNSSTGGWNIGVGYQAGANVQTGTYDIEIGNQGTPNDTNVIRIGDANQTQTFISGIYGAPITGGAAVLVNSNGQLGVQSSSGRYKEDIHDMGDASKALMLLRPVTFRYKEPDENGTKPLQYGLVAEEVAKIFPELVVRGKDGQVESVQYHQLPAMLLNEIQKQQRKIDEQEKDIQSLQTRLAELEKLLESRSEIKSVK